MNLLLIELRKEKRAAIIPLLILAGVLGAAYAAISFHVRRESLLNLPLAPTDILLTQVYGMILVLNLFGIVVAACMIYSLEYRGNAIRKMYQLPVSVPGMYLCKFLILTFLFMAAVLMQNLTLAEIGITDLPPDTFEPDKLIHFSLYCLATSMPVLSFMVLVSSRSENMWIPIGVGVAGFLSGMALVNFSSPVLMIHPFVIMLKPAAVMNARPSGPVIAVAMAETLLFSAIGLKLARKPHCE